MGVSKNRKVTTQPINIMNKNLLKWILIAAVILGAAGYLILSETSSNSKKEQIVVGHSKPFKIEPVEGITISAPKNALDKNREFKLKPVDNKTYDRLTKLVADEGVTPLFVFDFDAGLKSDEYFPGDFDVEWDLDKMGIPRSLQDGVCVYRIAGKGKNEEYIKYSSRVSNGKLRFRSNQNSYWELCLDSWKLRFYKPFVKFLWEYTTAPSQTIQRYFFNEPTRLAYPVQDDSGDFVLYFRFRDTEVPDGFDAFAKNEMEAMARIEELEKYAKAAYKAQLKQKYQEANVSLWDQIFPSEQVKAIKENISVKKILQDTALKDPELIRLNAAPEANPPKSILTIRDQVIRANQYLNSIGLHHQDFELPIYLVNDDVMTESINGAAKKYSFCGDAFMLVNYTISRLLTNGNTIWERMQCTLVHELCHVRQQCYYAYLMMNGAPAEGSVVVLERDAAKLWFKNKLFETNPNTETGLKSILTGRDDKFIFSFPLDKATSMAGSCGAKDADWAYTIGDAIEGIRKGVGKDSVNMKPFLEKYSFSGPHVKGWTGWIKSALEIDDKQLDEGWKYYGETKLGLIYASQNDSNTPEKAKTTTIKLAPGTSIAHLESLSKPKDYSVNTFLIDLPKERIPGKGFIGTPGNVFVYSKDNSVNPYVTLYLSDKGFNEYTNRRATPSVYCEKNTTEYMLAAVATCQSKGDKCDYYVAVLFAPNMPIIRKVKTDEISFVMPSPPRDLKKAKLITGAVITYKDKNGIIKTREVEPKYFGKKVKWTIPGCSKNGNSFTLSAHWYYKPDEQTTYVSPESEPAQWGAKGDQPEEEENVQTKEPETNYWKQVSSRMTMKNTSIDVDESNDDEVSSDYRSIDLQAAKTGRSLEFTGMGATEEKTKENGRVYVQDIFIEGTLTYTEPPKFWIPTQQYKAHWEIADDPYLTKVSDPFVFEAKNTSSDQAACAQSKKDKIDNGRSSVGKVNWPRGSTTTFEARHPEKNGPKSFTLTQTYSIKERQGSDLMATVTFVYNYEWVGEEEPEPEVEEETVPEGGYWKMVKSFEDKSRAIKEDKSISKAVITGGGGNYKFDYIKPESKVGTRIIPGGKASQSATLTPPKKTYLPGEQIGFDYSLGDLSVEGNTSWEVVGVSGNEGGFDLGRSIYDGIPNTSSFTLPLEGGCTVGKGRGPSPHRLHAYTYEEAQTYLTGNQFSIVDRVNAGGAGFVTVYVYEWVDGGKKAKPVKESAKEKPITGGHWKLIHTGVSTEQGMITGSAKGITIQGSNGHYTAHVERDGMISDREINFEKPKSVYMPGEEITLKVTNEKPKIKGGKEGMSYGDIVFSTGQWDGCVEYEGDWDDKPSYSNKKVVGVAKGSAPSKPGTPGAVGFFITEYIKVYGSMSKISTTYNYAWEE